MIGRRGVLGIGAAMLGRGFPGGNPPMRPDQVAQLPQTRAGSGPAPQSTVVTARRVIVIGANGGVFSYSPTPAAGNLVASTGIAQAGTDQYGNAYLAGDTVYTFNPLLGIWVAAQLGSITIAVNDPLAGVVFWTSPGTASSMPGPWTQQGGLIGLGAAAVGLAFPQGGGNYSSFELAATNASLAGASLTSTAGTAANPTLITTDVTHGLGALGVANLSITTANFTLLPDGGCFISIKGSATGAVAGGSTAFPNSLPAQYTPATTTLLPAMYGGVIAAGENRPRLIVGSSGQVTLVYPTLANGNSVSAGGRYDLQ